MPKYEIIIYWSAEDQSFVAEVPELPGMRRRWAEPSGGIGQCRGGDSRMD